MSRNKFSIPKEEYVVPVRTPREIIPEKSGNIKTISCDNLIMDNENSKIYGEESAETVKELAHDMEQNGFKGAILAYPENGKYKIESGHRRFMAAKLAGISEIPVIITETPQTESERRIRLISMNLHSRDNLKPTVMAKVIQTLMEADKQEQERKGLPTDIATLMDIVASQVELSTKSIEKYRQIPKLIPELQNFADNGISWSALIQGVTLPPEQQKSVALSIKTEIERVGTENVSRQWISSLITRMKQEIIGQPAKVKTVVKRRDGAKIVEKCVRDFEDIANGNAIFKNTDKKNLLENLLKIRECVDKKIQELQ